MLFKEKEKMPTFRRLSLILLAGLLNGLACFEDQQKDGGVLGGHFCTESALYCTYSEITFFYTTYSLHFIFWPQNSFWILKIFSFLASQHYLLIKRCPPLAKCSATTEANHISEDQNFRPKRCSGTVYV